MHETNFLDLLTWSWYWCMRQAEIWRVRLRCLSLAMDAGDHPDNRAIYWLAAQGNWAAFGQASGIDMQALGYRLPPKRLACRVCGCTTERGCPPDDFGDSCWWVENDLCSRCTPTEKETPQ